MACGGVSPTLLEEISEKVSCRGPQIQLLLTLFQPEENYAVQGLFMYGHTATGKTFVLRSVLESLQSTYVTVNCVECYNARLTYEHILNQLSMRGKASRRSASMEGEYKCDNMNDFVLLLTKLIKERSLDSRRVYIVFEKAERLRDMEINMLPAFLRLQDLSGLNITVILQSEIVWEKFRTGTGFLEPYIIHFADYSKDYHSTASVKSVDIEPRDGKATTRSISTNKGRPLFTQHDEMVELMALDYPTEYSVELYRNFCNILLSVFHLACKNLNELRHLAALNFPKYVQPIEKGEATADDMRKLWRNIEPHLKKALQTVYLREVSSAQWERMQEGIEDSGTSTVPNLSTRANIELPFYSKYLLSAAYLASYNPAKSDKRFFAKHSGRINKRSQMSLQKKEERTSSQLLGPKPFPLDRLLAIFYSIVEGRVAPTANIFSQITSLVTLGLLGQVVSSDQLECPKYKCLVSLDFIRGVSRTVSFEITRHLYDFAG